MGRINAAPCERLESIIYVYVLAAHFESLLHELPPFLKLSQVVFFGGGGGGESGGG